MFAFFVSLFFSIYSAARRCWCCLFFFIRPASPGCLLGVFGQSKQNTDSSLVSGRLYRSGAFSDEQLNYHKPPQQHYHLNHYHDNNQMLLLADADGSNSDINLVAGVSSPQQTGTGAGDGLGNDSDGGSDPHRSSFVKFAGAEDSGEDGEEDGKETPFVRHNTPHPKDLKAKAQKHFKGKKIDGKVVHHDEQDGLREGEAFRPGQSEMIEKPYRRSSPLPPLQLIDLPDRDADYRGTPSGSGQLTFQQPPKTDSSRASQSPSPVHERAVAFVDQHEHRDIEECDENEVNEKITRFVFLFSHVLTFVIFFSFLGGF